MIDTYIQNFIWPLTVHSPALCYPFGFFSHTFGVNMTGQETDQEFDREFDYIVVGGGSGGVRSARVAAQLGAKVALVESSDLGGTCVNLGCVPKKLFSYAASFHKASDVAASYGWQMPPGSFDWAKLIDRKNKEIARLNAIYQRLLEQAGVEIFSGFGSFSSADTIKVSGHDSVVRTLKAKKILIATGGKPFVPDFEGAEHALVSDDLFHLPSLPERILIYGSGYIAVEFASIFNGLGVHVDLVYRGQRMLKHFDSDISQALYQALGKQGIQMWSEREIVSVQPKASGFKVSLSGKGADGLAEIDTNLVVAATGRVPNVSQLALEKAGIATVANGRIPVDSHFLTENPNVYAVGDVIDRVALTPVAIREGANLANMLFGSVEHQKTLDYELIPTAVFTDPQVATVGLTEAQVIEKQWAYQCYKSEFKPMKYSFMEEAPRSFMKMIVDTTNDRVLGLHMVGEDAAEMMQGLGVAVGMKATKADFDATVGIHPSSAEEWVTLK